jgi:hypothetical protein
MKNKIFIISLLAVLFCSCEDYLNRQPLTEYSESSLWKSEKDALIALNGCYQNWESGHWIIYMDVASDNAFNPYSWEGFQMYGNMMLLTPTNAGNHKWNFNTIQKCNWFLANVDVTPGDKELIKRMKGEARFLRAYKYFVMAQLYGDVPLIINNISTTEANSITRTSKDEVINFVLSELAAITNDLPESYPETESGRITRGAAWALKARVELFNQKYEECLVSCNNILGTYSLFPDYTELFRIQNENNSEIILDIEYLENDVEFGSLGVLLPQSVMGAWNSIDPIQPLIDAYEMSNGKTIDDPSSGYDPEDPYKDRDPRLEATVIRPGALYYGAYFNPLENIPGSLDYYATENYSGFAVRKYAPFPDDFSDIWNVGLNIPVIRYAEVLLTYAEAKIELNQIDNSVYEAIDEVRNRVGMPVVDRTEYSTQTKLRELVRRERRVELAMEGLRWYDVQRWRIASEVMTGQVYGSRLGTVDMSTGKLTFTEGQIENEIREFDETKNYLWPIPQSEMDINKKLVQNPNY